jgi:hypothetical protein
MFGHNQSLAGGLIMRSSIARELAKNMPNAYTLLPSEKYYEYSPNSDRLLQETEIRNYARLNKTLWDKSKELHRQLDSMVYPEGTGIYQILGIGVSTLFDISLDEKNIFKVIPLYDKAGDGVVQDLHSSRQGTVMYVDLTNTAYKHANIMNSDAVIRHIDTIIHPPRTDIPEVGLDYNKIIKNNPYKLLRITPSNPNNKLSQYLTPLDMELSIGMSRVDDNATNILYLDRYDAGAGNNFLKTIERGSNNRFEEYDNGVNYLHVDTMKNFSITPKSDNVLDISILERMDGEISSVEYQGIPVFKNSEMKFALNLGSDILNLTLPITGQIVQFVSQNKKLELTLGEKADHVIDVIRSSKMEWYLKDRYIRRVELYKKNQDPKYLETVKGRVTAAIRSIASIAYSTALKSRYAKAKEDYIYLNLLLLKL